MPFDNCYKKKSLQPTKSSYGIGKGCNYLNYINMNKINV